MALGIPTTFKVIKYDSRKEGIEEILAALDLLTPKP